MQHIICILLYFCVDTFECAAFQCQQIPIVSLVKFGPVCIDFTYYVFNILKSNILCSIKLSLIFSHFFWR